MQSSFKDRLKPIAYYCGLPFFKIVLRRISGKRNLTILLYHRVGPQAAPFFGTSVSPIVFEKQIRFLKRNYKIIDFQDLKLFNFNYRSYKDLVILTFDDGYRDNFLYAYPILKKYGIPATIFLATDFIGTGKLLWPDKLAWILYEASAIPTRSSLMYHKISKEIIHHVVNFYRYRSAMRIKSLEQLASILKKHSEEQLEDILSALTKVCKIKAWPEGNIHPMLSWKEVEIMSANYISFGSHTKSHPFLSNTTLDRVKIEIAKSRKEIEKHIQKPVTTFAYPYGKRDDYTKSAVEILKEEGFEYACSSERGSEVLPLQNFFNLKRKGISTSPYLFL